MTHKYLVLAIAAFAGLGMSMPSCPGQQELKDQIATLQQTNDALGKRVTAMDTQVKTLSTDMGTAKQLLQEITSAVKAQQEALNAQKTSLEQLQARLSKPAAAPAKGKAAAPAKKRK